MLYALTSKQKIYFALGSVNGKMKLAEWSHANMKYFYRTLYQRKLTESDKGFLERNGYVLLRMVAPPLEKDVTIAGSQLVTDHSQEAPDMTGQPGITKSAGRVHVTASGSVDPASNPAPSQVYADNWFDAQGPMPTQELIAKASHTWSITHERAAAMYAAFVDNMTPDDGRALKFADQQLRFKSDVPTLKADIQTKFAMTYDHAAHIVKRALNAMDLEAIPTTVTPPGHGDVRLHHMDDFAYTELAMGPSRLPLIKQEIVRRFAASDREADSVIRKALSKLSSSKQAAQSASQFRGPGQIVWNRMPGEQGVLTDLQPTGPNSVKKKLADTDIWFMVLSARWFISVRLIKNGKDLPTNSTSKATDAKILQIDQSGVNDEDGNVRTVRLETPMLPDGTPWLKAGTYEIDLTSNAFKKTYTMVVA